MNALLLALFVAQVGPASNLGGTISHGTGQFLRTDQYRTPGTGALTYYVDAASGSDSNACTASGASACATIQGAVNKMARLQRDRTTVSIAAGNYAGFVVSGFSADFGTAPSTAGVLFEGALANSTGLASGTATGTATGGSAGSTSTFGTIVDAAQTWTVNDLRGRFVTITGGTGSGQVKVIASNTATTITIAGTWTAPVAGSTYAVQDSSVFITSCVTPPASGSGTPATANTAVRFEANAPGMSITLRGIAISAACTFAFQQPDAALAILNRVQFASGSGTASRMALGGPFLVTEVASTYPSTTGTHINGGPNAVFNTSVVGGVGTAIAGATVASGTIQNSLFVAGLAALNLAMVRTTILGLELVNINTNGVITSGFTTNLQGLHIDCTNNASAVGLRVSTSSAFVAAVSPDHVDFTDCATAVLVDGNGAYVDSANATTTSAVTTGLQVNNGGLYTFTGTGTLTGTSNDISLDSGAVTAAFADIVGSGTCLNTTNYNSRVCRD